MGERNLSVVTWDSCDLCGGTGEARDREPCDACEGTGELHGHQRPTPADLLTDPRVRALVEALRFSEGIVANESDTTEIMAALAPFEEVPRG